MTYQIKPLACDPARLNGLSEKLIVSHYENNYRGAVPPRWSSDRGRLLARHAKRLMENNMKRRTLSNDIVKPP